MEGVEGANDLWETIFTNICFPLCYPTNDNIYRNLIFPFLPYSLGHEGSFGDLRLVATSLPRIFYSFYFLFPRNYGYEQNGAFHFLFPSQVPYGRSVNLIIEANKIMLLLVRDVLNFPK